ncbi:MAG: bifunctional (p)ppGpp synthetase/guanosine-3',5'-bis(diphosphate) 3'-pyrophosphohydrolase [Deltaproteobacteria bacterium]|jgi:GTP pyrophosphokinase|nr:bifunctional (p)ppGpp synthetase/guanosine-3',5'-bis(diphosphate) 3'-pyrophosphohydrolase [Deltaproteobacteria bacterium]
MTKQPQPSTQEDHDIPFNEGTGPIPASWVTEVEKVEDAVPNNRLSSGLAQPLPVHSSRPKEDVYQPLEGMPVYGSRPVRIGEIIDSLLEQNPDADDDMVRRAYVFAASAHHGMTRRSGEPYLNHPLAVAAILCDMKLDISAVAAGLLHDTVEDTDVKVEDIRKNFGVDVANIVDGVTKIGKFNFNSATEREASNMRKMILAMLTDLRVILVKLADRLNNMRTLGFMPQEKQRQISKETLEIFAPLASRLGIHKIQSELEDLSLFYAEPETYDKLRQALSEGRNDRQAYVTEVKAFLTAKIAEFGIKAEIEGRPKHIYSIWRKMNDQNLPFEQIFDLVAFRIIVNQVQDCYSALGVIHSIFKPIPGRFKDYISLPKNNGYRSLHTAVVGLNNTRMEIQIRTHEMHSYAEDGIAAHWRYKDGGRISDEESQRINALRSILSWQSNLEDPRAFLNSIKESLAQNESIFVFTPTGDVKELPVGATPLDFAYSIHTDVGHHCGGARVNGIMANVRQKLQNGDAVEIITSRVSSPSSDWLRHVASTKAKTRIRQWLAAEEKKQAVEFGCDLITQEMRRHKIGRAKLTKEVLSSLGFDGFDELNAAVAFGKLSLKTVMTAIKPELKVAQAQEKPDAKAAYQQTQAKPLTGVLVKGIEDVFVRYGKCCTPVPGEPIVGFLTQGKGVTVHTSDCRSLVGLDPDRFIDVTWDTKRAEEVTYDIYIKLQILHVHGALSRIVAVITEHVEDIVEAHTGDAKEGRLWFRVAVNDFNQYLGMLSALKAMTNVVEWVERFYPADSDNYQADQL